MTSGNVASKILAETARWLRTDLSIYLAIIIYTIIGFLFLKENDALHLASYDAYVKKAAVLALLLFPVAFLFFDFVTLVHRFDKGRKRAFLRAFSANRIGSLFAGSLMLTMIMVFEGTFTSIKNTLVARFTHIEG